MIQRLSIELVSDSQKLGNQNLSVVLLDRRTYLGGFQLKLQIRIFLRKSKAIVNDQMAYWIPK